MMVTKKHHSFLRKNGRKIYELNIIRMENIKEVILATIKKIIKEEITRKHCGRGKAHLLLIFIRPRRVAPPLESFYKFTNLNP